MEEEREIDRYRERLNNCSKSEVARPSVLMAVQQPVQPSRAQSERPVLVGTRCFEQGFKQKSRNLTLKILGVVIYL